MTREFLRWSGRIVAVVAAAAIVLGSGVVGGTHALFNGETQNANNKFAADWVAPPTGLAATLKGSDVALSWTAGTHNVSDQQVLGYDAGATNSCTSGYALLSDLASATATTYTDTARGSGATDGHYYCYEVTSTWSKTSAWQPGATLAPLQVGLVPTALTIANVATAGSIANTDTITITFNQKTALTAGSTARVCVYAASATLVLGDSSGTCAAATDGNSVGTLKLAGATIAANANFASSTISAVSAAAPWTVTVRLNGGTTQALTGTPTWTYAADTGTTLESASGNGTQVGPCTTSSPPCQPSTTSSF